MGGGGKPHFESNAIHTRGAQRAQTKPCVQGPCVQGLL